MTPEIFADGKINGGPFGQTFSGTSQSDKIVAWVESVAQPPWGRGEPGPRTLKLPAGVTLISLPIMLPSTHHGYIGPLTGALRIEGEGSGQSMLAYLGDTDLDKDFVIGWQFFELPILSYEDAGDGHTWAVFGDDPDRLAAYLAPGKESTKPGTHHRVEILGGPYNGIHDFIGLDFTLPKKIKIRTPFKGDNPGKAKVRFLCRALDQKISGLTIKAPRKIGAHAIRRENWDSKNWEKNDVTTYSWAQVNKQRTQLSLDDVRIWLDSAFNPAAIRVEGSWFKSDIRNLSIVGRSGRPHRFSTYLIHVDSVLPEGGRHSSLVNMDMNGMGLGTIENVGGQSPVFRGRMFLVSVRNVFAGGDGKSDDPAFHEHSGRPTFDIINSARCNLWGIANEGFSEEAEMRITRSANMVIENYTGGGASAFGNDRTIGDMIQIVDSENVLILRRAASGRPNVWGTHIDPRFDNPGETAFLRITGSRNCRGEGFDMDVSWLDPASQWNKSIRQQLGLAVRIDSDSAAAGCLVEGNVSLLENGERATHSYQNQHGVLTISGE